MPRDNGNITGILVKAKIGDVLHNIDIVNLSKNELNFQFEMYEKSIVINYLFDVCNFIFTEFNTKIKKCSYYKSLANVQAKFIQEVQKNYPEILMLESYKSVKAVYGYDGNDIDDEELFSDITFK